MGQGKHQLNSSSKSSERKGKKVVELSEVRKSLRRQRNILSGRAESCGKLNHNSSSSGGNKLSLFHQSSNDGSDISVPMPNIYATLRKQKKKCKSLNGDLRSSSSTSTFTILTNNNNNTNNNSTKKCSNFELKNCDNDNSLVGGSEDNLLNINNNNILNIHQLFLWLKEIGMEDYKDLLASNGYDNLDFMVWCL